MKKNKDDGTAINYYPWTWLEADKKFTPNPTPTTDFVTKNKSDEEKFNEAVTASKTITGTETENKFNIKLEVTTTQPVIESSASPDSAVVLVIDISGSMNYCSECGFTDTMSFTFHCLDGKTEYQKKGSGNDCKHCGKSKNEHNRVTQNKECTSDNCTSTITRLDAAKVAAKTFINGFADVKEATDAKRYVSLVTFDGSAHSDNTWVDVTNVSNKNTLIASIEALNAASSTNVAGGLQSADGLLKQLVGTEDATDHTALTRKQAFVLLLGDGEPTKSDDAEPPAEYLPEGKNTNKTYAEGWSKKIRAGGTQILAAYAGTSKTADGYTWFKTISDKLALCGSITDLQKTFNDYLIWIRLANKAWVVDDPMGENISYTLKEGHNYKLTIDKATNSFKWHLNEQQPTAVHWMSNGSATEINYEDIDKEEYKGKTIRLTYIMEYSIYLDPVGANAATEEYGLTNGLTTLTYYLTNKDEQPVDNQNRPIHEGEGIINGIDGTLRYPMPKIAFNVPKVKALAAPAFNITKTDADNAPLAGAVFTIDNKKDSEETKHSEFEKTATSATETGLVVIPALPSGVSYTLDETTVPTGYVENPLLPYTVNVAWGVITDITDIKGDPVTPQNGESLFSISNPTDKSTEKVTISGEKIWAGDTETDRPESIYVGLFQDGVFLKSAEVKADSTDVNKWKYSFEVPAKHKNDDELIIPYVYTVRELLSADDKTGIAPDGTITLSNTEYTVTYNGYNITNTKASAKTASFKITKTWVDLMPLDGTELKVGVYNESGTLVDTVTMEPTADGSATWEGTTKELPLLGDGNKYMIKEVGEDNDFATFNGVKYAVEYSQDGYAITNTPIRHTSFNGVKTWSGTDAPADVELTIQLYADGVAVQDDKAKVSTSADDNWEFKFTGLSLPVYKLDETTKKYKEIDYSVRELTADETPTAVKPGGIITLGEKQYTVTYGRNATDGFTVSNSLYTTPVYRYELELVYTTIDSNDNIVGGPITVIKVTDSRAETYNVTVNPNEYKVYANDNYTYDYDTSYLLIDNVKESLRFPDDDTFTTVNVDKENVLHKVVLNYSRTLEAPTYPTVTVNYYESGTTRVLRAAYVENITDGAYDVSAQKFASLQYNGSTYNFSSQSGAPLKGESIETDQVINLYYTKANKPVYPDWDPEPTPTPTPTEPEWITSPQTGESAQNWSLIAFFIALAAVAVLTVKRKAQDK